MSNQSTVELTHATPRPDVLVDHPTPEMDTFDMRAAINELVKEEVGRGFTSSVEANPEILQSHNNDVNTLYAQLQEQKGLIGSAEGKIQPDSIRQTREAFTELYKWHDATSKSLIHNTINLLAEDIPKQEILQKVFDKFIDGYMPIGSARRAEAVDLNAQMNEFESMNFSERLESPTAIVTVPIAIHDENIETLNTTLRELAKQQGADNIEIVLFANSPLSQKDQASAGFQSLLDLIDEKYKHLHIRPSLRLYDDSILSKYSMMRVRSDYMDAVILDIKDTGRSIDTPVVWVDADTIKMTPNTIEVLARQAQETGTVFAAPDLRYTVDGFSASRPIDPSNAGGAAAMHELVRRSNKSEGRNIYDEEAGFTMRSSVYALCGGVNRSSRTIPGESKDLTNAILGGEYFDTPLADGLLPRAYATSYDRILLGTVDKKVFRGRPIIPSGVRMYVSARRQVNRFSLLPKYGYEKGDDLVPYDFPNFHTESYRRDGTSDVSGTLDIGSNDLRDAIFQRIDYRNPDHPSTARVVKKLGKLGITR